MKNNPYVGLRPYEWEDRHNFYGRKREARELRALIVAERVVLFYAQSGAGKTSLLNARVIPALEEKGFNVLPVARVGSELPPGIEPEAVENVFVFSALMALAGEETSPETLLGHTLHSFLEPFCPEPEGEFESRPPVLILDQFEELFTTHRERWQDTRGFFLQVREALDALPSLGVVFAMREDRVAELDPYAPLFPRRLQARFRMERLGPKGALAAVSKPALNAGCRYDPGVAERLVDDLRRIKVQRHGGAGEETVVLGPFVEPVQLQVVCHRLWENLPEQEDQAIQWEEVQEYGNIDRALTDFYESALAQAVQETGVSERQARRWFSEQLITPMETRGLALRGEEETAGLPNAAVDVLEKLHLIRADVRAGARWYELPHDRLVEPIFNSNYIWLENHSLKMEEYRDKLSKAQDALTEQDERVRQSFESAVKMAHRYFILRLSIDIIVFFIGIALIAASVWATLSQTKDFKNWVYISLVGGTGILGVLYSLFIAKPRDRVREATQNLMRLQVLFLGYLRQLHQIDGAYTRRLLVEDDAPTAKEMEQSLEIISAQINTAVQQLSMSTKTNSPTNDRNFQSSSSEVQVVQDIERSSGIDDEHFTDEGQASRAQDC